MPLQSTEEASAAAAEGSSAMIPPGSGKGGKRTPRGAAVARLAAATSKSPRLLGLAPPRTPSKRIPPMAPISAPSPAQALEARQAAAAREASAGSPGPHFPPADMEAHRADAQGERQVDDGQALPETLREGSAEDLEGEQWRQEQLQLLKMSGLSRKARVSVGAVAGSGGAVASGKRRVSSSAPRAKSGARAVSGLRRGLSGAVSTRHATGAFRGGSVDCERGS